MKNESGGQRFDDDILRCKEEILRLKGVVPAFGRPPKRTSPPPALVRQEPEPAIESTPLPIVKTVQPIIDMPSQPLEIAAENIEQTAVQTIVEDTAPQPSIQEAEFEQEPEGIPAKEDDHEEAESLVEDRDILAALEAEAAKTAPAPVPELEAELELEFEPVPVSDLESDGSEIPECNLAEQIMAEQRKVVGNRRKGPGGARFEIKEVEQQTQTPKPTADLRPPTAPVTPPPTAAPIRIISMEAPMSPQQKVIADIVARDINKFYQTRKVS